MLIIYRIPICFLAIACCVFAPKHAVAFFAKRECTTNITNEMYAPVVIYVNSTAEIGGNGASWNTAFRYLQDALSLASTRPSAEIWVAKGTYFPDDGARQ